MKKKAKEQFELFSYDEVHGITEWENAQWICECPKVQTEMFGNCNECRTEAPGGSLDAGGVDLTIFWEK